MESITTTATAFFAGLDQAVHTHEQRAMLPFDITMPFEETVDSLHATIARKESRIEKLTKMHEANQSFIEKLNDTIDRKTKYIEKQRANLIEVHAKREEYRQQTLKAQLSKLKFEHRGLMKVQCHLLDSEALFDHDINEMEVACQMDLLKILKKFRQHKALYYAARNGRKPTQAYYDKLRSLHETLMGLEYDWYTETEQYSIEANERAYFGVDSDPSAEDCSEEPWS